jgi:hypothetical protein
LICGGPAAVDLAGCLGEGAPALIRNTPLVRIARTLDLDQAVIDPGSHPDAGPDQGRGPFVWALIGAARIVRCASCSR